MERNEINRLELLNEVYFSELTSLKIEILYQKLRKII